MFKFKSGSYSVKKENEKDKKSEKGEKGEKQTAKASASSSSSSSSSSTGTLRKNPHVKTKPSAEQIKHVNNKNSPEYSKKNTTKTTEWHKNKTFSAKPKTENVVIPSPHKKLERK